MLDSSGVFFPQIPELKRWIDSNPPVSPERLLAALEETRVLDPKTLAESVIGLKKKFATDLFFYYEMRALSLAIFTFGLNPISEPLIQRLGAWQALARQADERRASKMISSVEVFLSKFKSIEDIRSHPPNCGIPEGSLTICAATEGIRPYLSIVVTTRNDNHGGDLTKRTRLFLNTLAAQVRIFRIEVEVVLVEWNPPGDTQSLVDELDLKVLSETLPLNVVTVPASIHDFIAKGARCPLYQMIAKNVGIRRAKGEYVLCTNVDIIFSNELISFLASKPLMASAVYRADRWDVRRSVYEVPGSDLHTFISEIDKHAYRVNVANGFRDLHGDSHEKWDNYTYSPDGFLGGVYTNACGDFQLMSRRDWDSLRGYPEWNLYSMHLDSVLQYKALSKGMREVRLPVEMRVYHVDHGDGWSLESERSGQFEVNVKSKLGIQKLGFDQLRQLGYSYFALGGGAQENSEDWGLKNAEEKHSLQGVCLSLRRTLLSPSTSIEGQYSPPRAPTADFQHSEASNQWEEEASHAIDYLHRVLPDERPIMVWGSGARGSHCVGRLCKLGRRAQVVGYIDSDQRKWGLDIGGLPVHSPYQMAEVCRPFIKVASYRYSEIEQLLQAQGLIPFVDYL